MASIYGGCSMKSVFSIVQSQSKDKEEAARLSHGQDGHVCGPDQEGRRNRKRHRFSPDLPALDAMMMEKIARGEELVAAVNLLTPEQCVPLGKAILADPLLSGYGSS